MSKTSRNIYMINIRFFRLILRLKGSFSSMMGLVMHWHAHIDLSHFRALKSYRLSKVTTKLAIKKKKKITILRPNMFNSSHVTWQTLIQSHHEYYKNLSTYIMVSYIYIYIFTFKKNLSEVLLSSQIKGVEDLRNGMDIRVVRRLLPLW